MYRRLGMRLQLHVTQAKVQREAHEKKGNFTPPLWSPNFLSIGPLDLDLKVSWLLKSVN